ncbi:hypothetical protein [Mycoplasmoides alvi]|uniref:hypothetical protein n=1 Tax=Mycoplasmoides alvi TaxID=78580 RepID=UPI00051AAE1D|nr:hypothetical protein [Mycoplasmoides alvi]
MNNQKIDKSELNKYIYTNKKNIQSEIHNLDLNFLVNNKLATEIVWRYAYKREILLDSALWNFTKLPHEDVYFNSYLVSKNYKILLTSEIFYIYRINNENSLMWNSQRLTIFEKIQIINEWFTMFPNWNIFNFQKCKEYWIWILIGITFSKFGFRKIIKILKKKNILYPQFKEIKMFCKKFYSNKPFFKKIYINLCLYVNFFDYLLPLLFLKICKIFNFIKSTLKQ